MGNYLYNGIKLPDINTVWTDKETYPYAYITASTSPRRLILTATNKKVMRTNGTCMVTATSSYDNYTVYELTDGEWVSGTYSGSFIAVWCSEDLYYSSVLSDDTDSDLAGTLYLAASDPIPVTAAPAPDPFWMTMGWMVGRMIAGMRGKREPVAYLYNGVRLPKLPEWDKTVYPYAVISLFENDYHKGYIMDISATHYVAAEVYPGHVGNSLTITTPAMCYSLQDSGGENTTSPDGAWVLTSDLSGETENYFRSGKYYSLFWANYDVSGSDGTVYLAASDPVPVYE